MVQIRMTVSELTLEHPLMEQNGGVTEHPNITLIGPVDGEKSRIQIEFRDAGVPDHGKFQYNDGIVVEYRYDATFYLDPDRFKQIYRYFCDRRDNSHIAAVYHVDDLDSSHPAGLRYHIVTN